MAEKRITRRRFMRDSLVGAAGIVVALSDVALAAVKKASSCNK